MNKKTTILWGAALAATTALTAPAAAQPAPPSGQITYQTLFYPGTTVTGATGVRGDNMTNSYQLPGTVNLGALLYRLNTGQFQAYPVPSAAPVNFPNAKSAQPYGPSFGSPSGILSSVGTFIPNGASANSSFIYDNAAAPGRQITVLNYPGAIQTIAHSQFGNQAVGNFNDDSTRGSPWVYNMTTGAFTSNAVPGSVGTSAYGIWGNAIAGGFTSPASAGGLGHAYIFNQATGAFTTYDAPGTNVIATHFEGITAGGKANEYNLIANSIDSTGLHTWAVHVNSAGAATWTELAVPGSNGSTTGNSIYENIAIGIWTNSAGITGAYIATVPGLYTPVTNTGRLTLTTSGTAISAVNGDDVVNTGIVTTTAPNSIGIASGQFSVIQNRGIVSVQAPGSAAVQMNGQFSTFLNGGIVQAVPGSLALQSGPTALGTMVVNNGIIDGQMSVNSGALQRFENSGLIATTAAGAGTTHTLSGVFVQTSQGAFAPRINNSTADMIVVNGQARLAGGVLANYQPGSAIGRSYIILTATGGYTGAFEAVATNGMAAFLSPNLVYSANSVNLNFTSTFANTSGLGGDQISTGRALDWAFNAGPGLSSMPGLFSLTSGQLRTALSKLSGDSTSLQISSAFAAGGQFNTLMSSRPGLRRAEELAQAPCDPVEQNACQVQGMTGGTLTGSGWGFWANAFGGTQWLNADSSTGAPTSQATILGGAFGADYRLAPNALVGVAVGLSATNYWMPSNGASGDATGVHVGLYGAYEMSGFYLNGSIAWSNFSNNQTRYITGIGTNETEQSTGTSNMLSGRIEVGRPFNVSQTLGGQVAVTPFLAFQPANVWTPAMSERSFAQTGGTGVFGLNYQSRSTASLPTFLGAQVDGRTEVGGRPLNAWVRASWVHEFLTARDVTAGFNVLPGTAFTVDGARAASDAARIDVGLRYALGNQASLFANGNVELSNRGQALAGTVGLRFQW